MPLLGAVTVAGQAVLPGDLINIGPWLRLLVAAPTTSGTTNFIHNSGSGGTLRPSSAIKTLPGRIQL